MGTTYWIDRSIYSPAEIATRFHHRLAAIHPFPNGNGRHAGRAADVLLDSLGAPHFTWGSQELNSDGDARSRYLRPLREADKGAIVELLVFVRS
jgi:fido (protein-threonine AMPylation protein)